MNITLADTSLDQLQEERWEFWVTDSAHERSGISLVLNSYSLLQRPTLRHKFRVRSNWERLRGRLAYATDFEPLSRPPELPPDIMARAKAAVMESIRIIVEQENGNPPLVIKP